MCVRVIKPTFDKIDIKIFIALVNHIIKFLDT